MLSTNRTCDSPASFDLAGRDLVIAQGKALNVTQGDGLGALSITGAASVSLQTGAVIQAVDKEGFGGVVSIRSAGPVTIAVNAKVNTSANLDGGFIDIEAQSDDLNVLGLLQAKASNSDGGDVALAASDGSVTVGSGGIIDASAPSNGDFNGGGSVDITASDGISLSGTIDLTGGDGGDLSAQAEGSIVIAADGNVDGSANDRGGQGATLELTAGVGVQVAGTITASALKGDDVNGGGAGGEVTITTTTGNVDIGSELDARGSKPDGDGGVVTVEAGLDLTVSAPVLAGIDGGGFAGSVSLSAGGRTSIASTLDVHADDAGGTIDIETGDTLTVQGTLLADGTGPQGEGGTNMLRACTLNVVHGAIISATPAGVSVDANNHLTASGEMMISGTLKAGDHNLLEYRDTPPSIGGGAVIDPEEELVPNPSLPCCSDACAPPPTTSTTSTTSTIPTTVPGTTSTTTALPGTSTTTTTTTLQAGSTSTSSTTPVTSPTTTAPTTTAPITTVPTTPVPTTTLPPVSCLNQSLAGFDLVDCYFGILSDALSAQSAEALGGAKPARALTTRIQQAQRLVTVARQKKKPIPTLRRAKKQLRSFRTLAQKGRRRRLAGDVADQLLTLADGAMAAIDQLRASIRDQTHR